MENTDIMQMISALEKNEKQVVTNYLQERWAEDVTSFIETVKELRQVNSGLVDQYFSTSQTLFNLAK
ncbi:MAG: hypothetical protein ABUK01_11370 [Leptospirales bacterium]